MIDRRIAVATAALEARAGGLRRHAACAIAALSPALAVAFLASVVAVQASASDLSARAKLFIDQQALPEGTDVEVSVGEPDARVALAECRRSEPFVPSGARLWGKTSLGVRCVDGATWTVFLPAEIKIYASMPVAARNISRGQPLVADDIRSERIELTRFPPGAFADRAPLEGRIATRNITPGEPFRRDLLRAPLVIQAGDPVRVNVGGGGFVVSTDGRALTAGSDGQSVQVAVAAGRVLTGIARPGKVIDVR